MKIYYIGSFKRIHDEEGIARTLESLGHTVIRAEEIYFRSIQKFIEDKPDLVLFAKLKIVSGLRQQLIDQCKQAGIPTICWVPDLYIGISRERLVLSRDAIFQADLVLTPDGGHDALWDRYKVNHRVLRQGMYQDECKLEPPKEEPFDICFVGTENGEFPYRVDLMERLQKRYGNRFRWIGRTNSDHVRSLDLNALYSSVKVVVGASVYSPRYWSNRVYETLGRGGFLIHPRIEGLDEEFTYYKHLVPYDYGDYVGLYEKIDYYLTHDTEREAIRLAGFEFTKENHTLLQRCKQLLSYYEDLLA